MKALRIAALGVALLAGSSALAGAQGATPAPQQQGGPGGGGRGLGRSLAGIELTDAQKAKLTAINEKYSPEMQALRETMQSGDRAEGMKKMQSLREKMSPEVRAVLTPEQQAIYDKNLAEQKARFEQMRKGAGR
jgi:Spy/CpxP family protein refolding chaperone